MKSSISTCSFSLCNDDGDDDDDNDNKNMQPSKLASTTLSNDQIPFYTVDGSVVET